MFVVKSTIPILPPVPPLAGIVVHQEGGVAIGLRSPCQEPYVARAFRKTGHRGHGRGRGTICGADFYDLSAGGCAVPDIRVPLGQMQ